MLAIARILRTGARFLMLDEPTEGLAPVIIEQIGRTDRRAQAGGLHDPAGRAEFPLRLDFRRSLFRHGARPHHRRFRQFGARRREWTGCTRRWGCDDGGLPREQRSPGRAGRGHERMNLFGHTISMPQLFGQLLIGLINGSFYALLSLGLAVIFGMLHHRQLRPRRLLHDGRLRAPISCCSTPGSTTGRR